MKKILIGVFLLVPVFAQPPADAPKPARPAPKNLKIIKPDQVRATMGAFRVALGVECSFCHVQGDFASDENKHKVIARHMMAMSADLNSKFPDGKQHITCYTCHRGATEPATAPPAAAPAGN